MKSLSAQIILVLEKCGVRASEHQLYAKYVAALFVMSIFSKQIIRIIVKSTNQQLKRLEKM
jgi:hypothetical protein